MSAPGKSSRVVNEAEPGPEREREGPGILIVEGEADLANTCVRFLRGLGYRTWVARTGSEALAAITTERPDLVIADLRLSGAIDGFEVVRHLRQREPRIRTIVWTTHSSYQTRQAALKAGAVGYLPKPFALAELRRAVAGALGPGGPPGGAATDRD
jgi:CheY-like chemotaxis protein